MVRFPQAFDVVEEGLTVEVRHAAGELSLRHAMLQGVRASSAPDCRATDRVRSVGRTWVVPGDMIETPWPKKTSMPYETSDVCLHFAPVSGSACDDDAAAGASD